MSNSLRDKMRAACERRYTTYTCEQLGEITIQSLSERERMQIELSKVDASSAVDMDQWSLVTARLIVATLVDEEHNRLFTEADVSWLSELDAAIAEPLRDAINEHVAPSSAESAKKNCDNTED